MLSVSTLLALPVKDGSMQDGFTGKISVKAALEKAAGEIATSGKVI